MPRRGVRVLEHIVLPPLVVNHPRESVNPLYPHGWGMGGGATTL